MFFLNINSDNAIEGILRSDGVDRNVLVHISSASDYISIFVENFASGPVDVSFRTSKRDKSNHGFGIVQMKSIAQKYFGDVQLDFNSETGKFSLNILLKNQRS